MATVSWILRQHGPTDADHIARLDLDDRTRGEGQEDVGARAEADEAEPSRLRRAVAGLWIGDDAPRDQARDLPHQHAPARPFDADRRLLVIETRLLLGGMQELALVVVQQLDRAVYRITVHMHVEYGEEDRDAHRPLFHVHRLVGLDHVHHTALRRRHHVLITARAPPGGAAEEPDPARAR